MDRGEPLRIGTFVLTEEEVRRRKAYVELRDEDEQLLREAHPHVVRHSSTIVERFYEYLLSHKHTREILSNPGRLEKLKEIQTQYFLELTAGQYDLAYFENRLRVGLTHERIGLSPQWYLGAYDKYLQIVTDVLSLSFGRDYERFYRTSVSLTKVIFLDMSLAIDAYTLSAQERLEQKNAEIHQANLDLKKLSADKRRITDMIVHDLKNPLAGISAFLQVLKERPEGLSEWERHALLEAHSRCSDMFQLILNVLQVSQAEDGRLDLFLADTDLAEIANRAVNSFALIAEQRGSPLSFSGSDESVMVRTDQGLFRRILDNLIHNALRHTPAGTRIEVIVRSEPSPAVLVKDNGPGVPDKIKLRIFEPGALRSSGIQTQDTGLGLWFCRLAADVLGMSLCLESESGVGTCFILEPHRPSELPSSEHTDPR
jgi:signal transduction histidine kinase